MWVFENFNYYKFNPIQIFNIFLESQSPYSMYFEFLFFIIYTILCVITFFIFVIFNISIVNIYRDMFISHFFYCDEDEYVEENIEIEDND